MENASKNNPPKKVNEPETIYKSKSETDNEEESNSVLNRLLEMGLKQIENGETRPHEVVMSEMRLKYNLK